MSDQLTFIIEHGGIETAPNERTSVTMPKLRHFMQQYEEIHKDLRLADRKAHAVISATSLLVAALAFVPSPVNLTVLTTAPTLAITAAFLVRILLLATVAGCAFCSLAALTPRLTVKGRESLYYFGHIANLSAERFCIQFARMIPTERTVMLLDQVRVIAVLLVVKYRWVQRAARLLIVAFLLWLAQYLLALAR